MKAAETAAIETVITWEGRTIRLSYDPIKWGIIDHLELCVDGNEALPITETGYRSHFFGPVQPSLTPDEVIAFVRAWLDEAALDPAWIEAEEKRSQLSLF